MPLTLRVSLLEQCQLSCAYCRPGQVVPPTARARWLRPSDYLRLCRLFAPLGVGKVRFTGGEPLLRPDAVEVVAALHRALPEAKLGLTTNGQRALPLLGELAQAGLQRITLHLDSLRPARYRALMGGGEVGQVLQTALAAREVLEEVKLNVVVQRGHNDDELWDFLAWSGAQRIQVRFIELMNTGSAAAYTRATFISGSEILARIALREPVRPLPRARPDDPAALYRTHGGVEFGVIASDTEPFCGACTRLRLSADGQLRGCLYQSGGAKLGDALRSGADDAALSALILGAVLQKRSHHPSVQEVHTPFSMADIGG